MHSAVGTYETKECPKCNKIMVKDDSVICFATLPPQYQMKWYCLCGHIEDAETDILPTREQIRNQKLEELNRNYYE